MSSKGHHYPYDGLWRDLKAKLGSPILSSPLF
jgi:hypothetical protein